MNETQKTLSYRKEDYDRWLNGTGLDIGCGRDKLKLEGRQILGFDQIGSGADLEGDANILDGVAHESFDFVYSSHCLEHMDQISTTLKMWGQVVKTGGYLYIVVPDYLLYERCQWPSRYNGDHKHSFTFFDIPESQRHSSVWDLEMILAAASVAGLELITAKIECYGYDWHLLHRTDLDQTLGGACANVVYVFRK